MAVEPLSSTNASVLPSVNRVPGVLRHLTQLSSSFAYDLGNVSYVHVYATPVQPGTPTAPPTRGVGPAGLKYIRAAQSGPEGIACVDDAARAALLALEVYEQQRAPAARQLAEAWLSFVLYMQEPDGRFVNFIVDRRGRKNRRGATSHPGGVWWTTRAQWALARGWRVTGRQQYLEAFRLSRLAGTTNLKVVALQVLALLELYLTDPSLELQLRIGKLCDRLVGCDPTFFHDRAGSAELEPWGYHQLQAVACAGRLFSRLDYLAACERTARTVVRPLIEGQFGLVAPWAKSPACAYDVSSLVLGLEELYRGTHRPIYREQALVCADWLTGGNPSGARLYNPRTGMCYDGLTDGVVSQNCGAESTIEAGFVELARRRLAR